MAILQIGGAVFFPDFGTREDGLEPDEKNSEKQGGENQGRDNQIVLPGKTLTPYQAYHRRSQRGCDKQYQHDQHWIQQLVLGIGIVIPHPASERDKPGKTDCCCGKRDCKVNQADNSAKQRRISTGEQNVDRPGRHPKRGKQPAEDLPEGRKILRRQNCNVVAVKRIDRKGTEAPDTVRQEKTCRPSFEKHEMTGIKDSCHHAEDREHPPRSVQRAEFRKQDDRPYQTDHQREAACEMIQHTTVCARRLLWLSVKPELLQRQFQPPSHTGPRHSGQPRDRSGGL